ncbi:putative type IX secretion system sortase PorU2 [Adhaeribacter radiodurans]|uniref:Gingipain domain-containing protein n=1 Tax=Adhaeribacter radiodurans TaxID=2745197 RepID=A0A7L7L564_9BACT|nr:C25 family cysteine peptidase [Adhaeribacter radiodurans]QMU27920.1 hypothetical protein HUW48_07625 [Adhaeribacter radiodurans]
MFDFYFSSSLKRIFLSGLLSQLFVLTVFGQSQYGNEWINYGQAYYKIKVAKTGIYRLDQAYLANAGLSNVNPQNLQLWRRGREVAIYVQGQEDGVLNPGDYLEFYGQRNDGQLDREFYKNPQDHANSYFSLYTDTAAYFLTVAPLPGKRAENFNLPATGLQPEPWHRAERLKLYTAEYQGGAFYGDNQMSWGDASEGYGDVWFGTIGSGVRAPVKEFEVDSLLNLEPNGSPPLIEILLEGVLRDAHNVTIAIVTPNGAVRQLESNIIFSPFDKIKKLYLLQAADISSAGKVKLRITVNAQGVADIVRVRYLRVSYARKNIFLAPGITISPSDTLKSTPSYYVLQKSNNQTLLGFNVTDPYSITKINVINTATEATFVSPSSNNQQQKILLVNAGTIYRPAPPQRIIFRSLASNSADFILLYHKRLAKPTAAYSNPVKAYNDYRASEGGGKHDTLSLEIEQVYDQFHYGEKSTLAIRHLMQYLLVQGKPQYLLLLGYSLLPDYDNYGRSRTFPTPASRQRDMIPTVAPVSDIFFTADWDKDEYYPKVATGRVAAQNPEELAAYFEKVKEHEALPDNLEWRKNILHLGGGDTEQLKTYIRNALTRWENMVEKTFLGGKVKTIYRLTTAGTEKMNVSADINAGVSLVTFFGHSSPTINDIDIGLVTDPVNGYNNTGKYPMMIMNGCATGNPFYDNTFGVNWLLAPKKGIILYLAHSSIGYANILQLYSEKFYEVAFTDSTFYGKPVGIIQQETIKRFLTQTQSPNAIAQAMQMFLQGDPAIRLFSPQKPDYLVQENGPFIQTFNNERLTAALDSFTIAIPVKNLGKAVTDSISVSVRRNNALIIDSVFFPAVYNQDTLYFKFVDKIGHTPGVNQFTILLDHLNKISESDETNNSYTFEYYFPANTVQALYPPEYAIVSEANVKLIGQALERQSQNQDYYFELDTSPQFSSSQKQSTLIAGAGLLPTWQVTLPASQTPEDSVVYYWRFRTNELAPGQDSVVWGHSSFRYIPGSPDGWSQSQPAQLRSANTQGIALDPTSQKWEFTPNSRKLILKTRGGKVAAAFPPNGILIDGRTRFDGTCGLSQPNILAVVFNDKTLEQYIMPANSGAALCGNSPKTMYHFVNLNQLQNQENLRRFLEAVPSGYYVALISVQNVPFSVFSPALKAEFRNLGSRLIDSVQTGYPIALVGRKNGAAGTAQERTYVRSEPTGAALQSIELSTDLTTRGVYGEITSTFVGPATEWSKIQNLVKKNGAGKDNYFLTVRGFDAQKSKDTLVYSNTSLRILDLVNLKAKRYPYLRLQLAVADTLDRTAPQLSEWLVLYKGTPEGLILADTMGTDKYKNLGAQAATGNISTSFTFQNISQYNFPDSLVARLTLIGNSGFTQDIKVKPLGKGELVDIPVTFPTRGLSGKYTLRLFVNPYLQPELVYTNNVFEVSFTVGTNIPPLLDVAFDGQHILDGDIVSPNPQITVLVKDEDKYSFLQNTEGLEMLLLKPTSSNYEQVNLTGSEVKVFPADKKNDFRVEFTPQNLANGIYKLRVQARDVSNNKAGFEPYEISFNVINESTITNFYPYPNPLSSKSRFVFTVTGAQIPQNLKVQILTITGKVIREITKEELGPIKIGNNTSEYAWDGTDEFGDKLANGVYLYRVVMDTDLFSHRNTTGDKSFTKGYGKLYILR